MSMLEKMLIQGVRSFGPKDKDKQVVEFFSPLTLILGPNGSGKTTIIECLRYSSTGDMPPNCGQGGPFVHDPKLANEIEVRGQVRLQFRNVANKRITITRSMTATQKAKKIHFKTLENTIQKVLPNGEKCSLSSKCAELTHEVTEALGVSKAVLTSVIFCHQEEANWPLGEGKAVKSRFDEIFSATRYIKALDNIKKLRKDLTNDVKLFKGEIVFLEQNKDKAKQITLDLRNTETRLVSSKNRVEEIDNRLRPIEDKLLALSAAEGEIHALEIDLEKQETLLKQLEKNKRELRGMIKNIFEGSKERLQEEINSFRSEVDNKIASLDDAKRKQSNLEHENESLRKQQAKCNLELGKLRTLEQQQVERIKNRDSKISKAAEVLNIPGYPSDARAAFTDEKVTDFMAQLQAKIDVIMGELQTTKEKYERQERQLQSGMDDIRDQRTQGEQTLKMNNERLMKNRNEIDKIARELRRVDNNAVRQQELETTLKQLEHEQTKLEGSVDVERMKKDILSLQKAKSGFESRLKLLNQEMSKLQLESEKRTEMEILEKDKNVKEDLIRKICNRHEDSLNNLLGAIPAENAHRELEKFSNKLASEIKAMERQISSMKSKMSSLETTRRHQMDELKKKENLLSSYQEKIFQVSGSSDFDDSMTSLSKTLRELQDEKGALIGSEFIYGKYVEKLGSRKPCCPLCQRGFVEDNEVQELISHIRRKIEMVPEQVKVKERHISEQQRRLNSMLELKPLRDEVTTLTDTEIPSIKQKLKTSNDEIEKLRKEIVDLEETVEMKQMDQASCNSIQPDMVLLHQHQSELSRLERQLDDLKRKLQTSGDCRTIQQVNQEREDAQNEFQTTMRDVEQKQEQLSSHTEKVNLLHGQINNKRAELLQITADQQKRQSLTEQKTKLANENTDLEKAMQESKDLIKVKEGEWQSIKSEKDQVLSKKEAELGNVNEKVDILTGHKTDIDHFAKEIKRYIREGRQEALRQMEEKITLIKSQMEEKEDESQVVSQVIQKLQKEIANQEGKQRELQDNMRLKDCDATIVQVQRKCHELQNKLGNIDTSNLFKEKKQLTEEHRKLTDERAQAQGRMQGIKDQIVVYKKDLGSDQFKDADNKYKDKLIDLKLSELANDDLRKYFKVLDTAVMRYHSLKMDEINKIIRELWTRTYKGHDIDYIEIRSDLAEDDRTESDKRRVYNYRVVMVCGDSELDMRGRCSAGQKVLASLIIRLALAETFCLNCGILALDEPTTNLDRDNIESLAYALIEVVKSRSGQKNFQLVIITHDEDFINLLGRAHFCDYFYKVCKNDSNACTKLQKCLMSELYNT